MLPDGTYSAVVDRIEDDLVALEVHVDEDDLRECSVPFDVFPVDAQKPDAVLEITIENESITTISYDSEATEQRKENAQTRFDRLARRPPEEKNRNENDPD